MEAESQEPINLVNDHHCFGCGRLNQYGLQLSFWANKDGNGVWTSYVPTADFEGYGGMIHGGIISTILDEVMAWSLYRQQTWAVTGQLTSRFRSPMIVGEPIQAVGQVIKDRGRVIEMRGEIRRESDNVLIADGTATFFRVPESKAKDWNARYLGDDATSVAFEGERS